jgi:hypothetical protein
MSQATNTREIPMFPTSSTTQIITPFGSGYVPMQHGEPTRCNLAPEGFGDMAESIRASLFSEMLKSLRSALYLK